MLSSALSVSKEHPERVRFWIFGACATIPCTAPSVILHEDRSRTRRFSVVCRKMSGGRDESNHAFVRRTNGLSPSGCSDGGGVDVSSL